MPTMEIIVSSGEDRDSYPGTIPVEFSRTLPDYNGSVTMSIQFTSVVDTHSESLITVDPETNGGVPSINGRWPISHILEKLASGMTADRLMETTPNLTLSDIQLALEATAWVMRDPAINWTELDLPGMVDLQHEIQEWQSLTDNNLDAIDDLLGD